MFDVKWPKDWMKSGGQKNKDQFSLDIHTNAQMIEDHGWQTKAEKRWKFNPSEQNKSKKISIGAAF